VVATASSAQYPVYAVCLQSRLSRFFQLANRIAKEQRVFAVQFELARQASVLRVVRRQQYKAQEHEHTHQRVALRTRLGEADDDGLAAKLFFGELQQRDERLFRALDRNAVRNAQIQIAMPQNGRPLRRSCVVSIAEERQIVETKSDLHGLVLRARYQLAICGRFLDPNRHQRR